MKITFDNQDNQLILKDYTIRNLSQYCDECEKHFPSDHLQAIVKDLRKKKGNSITCRIIYENSDGEFLGLDEDNIYGTTDSAEILISMPVSIPETAEKVRLTLQETKYPSASEYTDYIIGIGAIIVIVFAVKGVFDW